jgi:hypothetical protein
MGHYRTGYRVKRFAFLPNAAQQFRIFLLN